jgi:hypothetical protein
MKDAKTSIDRVNVGSADLIDWSRNCLPIGVKIPGQNSPWIELDSDDLKLLWGALNRELDPGNPASTLVALSPPFARLAAWARAAHKWIENNPNRFVEKKES